MPSVLTCLALAGVLGSAAPPAAAQGLGLFEANADVGEVQQKGSVAFDARSGEYRLRGSGENVWGTKDAFHFVWKTLPGDLSLATDVRFGETTGQAHRKGGWMVRQGLDADAPYADAVLHADGLISLQYRLVRGGETREIKSPIKGPAALRLDRTGDVFSLFVSRDRKRFQPVGAVSVPLTDPLQVGLGVASHDVVVLSSAVFSGVSLDHAGVVAAERRVVESSLEVIAIDTGEREVVYSTRGHFEAPNWTADGKTFVFNRGGKLYTLPREGGQPKPVNTGGAVRLNNDHGLSPDGKRLVISHSPEPENQSIMTAAGGAPRVLTQLFGGQGTINVPSWSPDSRSVAFVSYRLVRP